jgi:DNA-directed RNA polymerase
MDDLNVALRNQFIQLYQRDLLGDLHAELQARYNLTLPPPPKRGTLDLEQVRNSLYFFS